MVAPMVFGRMLSLPMQQRSFSGVSISRRLVAEPERGRPAIAAVGVARFGNGALPTDPGEELVGLRRWHLDAQHDRTGMGQGHVAGLATEVRVRFCGRVEA